MIEDKDVISEEAKSEVRQEALTKEAIRLKYSDIRKGKIITTYKVAVGVLAVLSVFFLLIYFNVFNTDKIFFSEKTVETVSENTELTSIDSSQSGIEEPTYNEEDGEVYYSVIFETLPHIIIAQFASTDSALLFSEKLERIYHEETEIIEDSEYTSAFDYNLDYNWNYSIQIGAYTKNHLQDFEKNLAGLKILYEDGMYKYRIRPFNGFSKAKANSKSLHKNSYYIVRE